VKLYEFMTAPDLCGAEFTGSSWAVHREVIARLWDGDTDLIPPEYHAVAQQLLGSEQLPQPGVPAEMYLAFVRRSGKTRFEAVAGVHAWAEDYRDRGLSLGEWATISCHCVDKRQARTSFEYCKGLIEASPVLLCRMSSRRNRTLSCAERSCPHWRQIPPRMPPPMTGCFWTFLALGKCKVLGFQRAASARDV
jgi:hypothetical protein